MKHSLKDIIISKLPEPFFTITIWLFMPGLWSLLKKADIVNQDTVLFTRKRLGHIVVNENGIKVIGE